ncbi:hypothetical protein OVA13_11040 [Pseudoxanthomonas sp. SL93]|uniref:hypothetical protein n=1 Tax=Pseudoxanthomonas sp. SL93 TaxID=2995142 RepID=UPI00226D8141|nr:hypothetical protein [Pseudoxanthomonas sp. SL93]WAC61939.1 hypothetical protein OVA13_11040 [Pseudoxanthomonas sp. SL93]
MKALVVVLAVASMISILLTSKLLHKLDCTRPEVLRTAGITKVDWWIDCVVGVFRLAFGPAGTLLDTRERWTFVSAACAFVWAALASVSAIIFPEFWKNL